MRVGDIASGRSGDKGEILDLTIVATDNECYRVLERLLTVEHVRAVLNRVVPGDVVRYELPGLRALKFVARKALPGGILASLHAGIHWQKAAIWLLLNLPVDDAS